MIYVTHDQIEAMTLANRIVVMAHGRVEQVGSPLDLYRVPATIRVAEAIGSPAMNFLAVRIARRDDAGAVVTLPDGSECPVAAVVPAAAAGAPATLGVRPEHLHADADGPFGGRVELFERLGPLSFAHLGEAGRGRQHCGAAAERPARHPRRDNRLLRRTHGCASFRRGWHRVRADHPLIPPPSTPLK